MSQSEEFMRRAVQISKEKMEANFGGPFGAVIVKDGKIIAEGFNKVTSSNDPTAHAEITAIREACDTLDSFELAGCEIYTSCEPCPMCLAAIYWARLDKVYFSNNRADAAKIGFDDDHIYGEIPKSHEHRSIPIVHVPLDEAKQVFKAWENKADKIKY